MNFKMEPKDFISIVPFSDMFFQKGKNVKNPFFEPTTTGAPSVVTD